MNQNVAFEWTHLRRESPRDSRFCPRRLFLPGGPSHVRKDGVLEYVYPSGSIQNDLIADWIPAQFLVERKVWLREFNSQLRTVFAFHNLDLSGGSIGTLLSGKSGGQSDFGGLRPSLLNVLGLLVHDVSLALQQYDLEYPNRNQAKIEHPWPPVENVVPKRLLLADYSDGRQAGEFYGVLFILALYGSAIWLGGNGVYRFVDERKRLSGSA